MAKAGKRYNAAVKTVEKETLYSLTDAVKLVKNNAKAKFDETIEVSMNLNVDPRHADQNLRGMVTLPKGSGKIMKVAVFAKGDKAEAAKKAGADLVGAEDLAEKVKSGDFNVDRVIATPDMMGIVGQIGRILGPKGLMPNPKLGTVTMNVEEAIAAAKGGAVEFRVEKTGIVQAGLGKASFKEADLLENVQAFLTAIVRAKPTGVKGTYIKKISLSSTMGPGVKLDISAILSDIA